MRQGGRYGVRLRASAPSLHIMKTDVTTEVAPIVGSESQSEELVMYLLKEFEENPAKIWESNIFGKSLHELVSEGISGKLAQMPRQAREKLAQTLQRIVNEQLHIAPIAQLDIDIVPTLAERVCHDMLHGEFAQPSHPKAGLSRTVWKWRRYRANRWKRRLVYRDPEIAILLRGLVGHLCQPRNLTHKH